MLPNNGIIQKRRWTHSICRLASGLRRLAHSPAYAPCLPFFVRGAAAVMDVVVSDMLFILAQAWQHGWRAFSVVGKPAFESLSLNWHNLLVRSQRFLGVELVLQHGQVGLRRIATRASTLNDALAQGGDGHRKIENMKFDAT